MILDSSSSHTLASIITSGLLREQKKQLIHELKTDPSYVRQENALCRSWNLEIKKGQAVVYEITIKLHHQTMLIDVWHRQYLMEGTSQSIASSERSLFSQKNLIHCGVIAGELLECYAFDLRFTDVRSITDKLQVLRQNLEASLSQKSYKRSIG